MLKNIVKVLVSNIVVMFTALINTLIIPKFLSIEGYAEYQTFVLYTSYIGLLTLGFQNGVFVKYAGVEKKNIDKPQFKSEMQLIIWSQLIISFTIFVISIILNDNMMQYMSFCILIINFVTIYKYLFQAWNMFTNFSVINVIQSLGFSVPILLIGLVMGQLNSGMVIGIYIAINLICFILLFVLYRKDVCGVKRKPMLSRENFRTFQVGILLILGSGANVVFHSVDKFFIKGLFTAYDFSMYCFGITLLNVMNVFINAIAQPMYIRLVSNAGNVQERKLFKQLLFCFGGLSGCAYYAVAIIVRLFLPKYVDSLKVVSILFAIFPAVAVINCLYINLYKTENKLKKYIVSLMVVIVCSVLLNIAGLALHYSYIAIAAATTVCYYVWLIISSKDFEGLHIQKCDVLFLAGFLFLFFGLTRMSNEIIGLICYFGVILVWEMIIYHETLLGLIKRIKRDSQ